MNNGKRQAAAALSFAAILIAHSSAFCSETIKYKKPLTVPERNCLSQILQTGKWRHSPDFHQPMMLAARAARVDLDGDNQKEYLFVIAEFGFCGTAGCSMLIAQEDNKHGRCHEIYSGAGSESTITVLAKRDHRYRRLYTPCEVRFDSRQYQQMRVECPNAVIHR